MSDKELIDCLTINTESSPWWQIIFKRRMIKVVKWMLSTKLSQKCYDEAGRIRENQGIRKVI